MTTPFPSPPGPERHAATEPHRTGRPTSSVDRQAPGRTWPLLAAIVLIAAGAVLLWMVAGTVAGIDTDVIGVAALALGGIALLTRVVTMQRSRRRDGTPAG